MVVGVVGVDFVAGGGGGGLDGGSRLRISKLHPKNDSEKRYTDKPNSNPMA